MQPIEQLIKSSTDFWNQVVRELVASLQKSYPGSSGNTAQSIGEFNPVPVQITAQGLKISIYMPKYYKFMDQGVSGAVNNKSRSIYKYTTEPPPISAIRQFMLNHGIVGRNYRAIRRMPKGRQRSKAINRELTSIAFAISRKIWRDGLEASHFFSNVVNDPKIEMYAQKIEEEYGELIIEILTEA